ncbi:DUF6527 family protein [Acinetobacter nosocomialis]|nr:DUF6527 family protein [Acinetobacter nosocomialis]MDO7215989.1 DUF6527 family protein [Acinetobacter nosocomialis]
MLKIKKLKNHFIRNIPRELEVGVLYISMEYATAVHSCCCGCGEQVVTPFSPTDWKMIYDGESVSLTPSVGNWNLTCRSHYIIKHNIIYEAGNWSDSQIKAERKRDKLAKSNFYQSNIENNLVIPNHEQEPIIINKLSWSKRFWDYIRSLINFLK